MGRKYNGWSGRSGVCSVCLRRLCSLVHNRKIRSPLRSNPGDEEGSARLAGQVSAAVTTRRLFALVRTVPKMPRHIAWFSVPKNVSQSPFSISILFKHPYSHLSRPSDGQSALVTGRPAKFNRESHGHVRRELRSPRATSADHRLPLVLTPSSVHCAPKCYSPAPSGRPEDGRLFSVRSRSFSLRRAPDAVRIGVTSGLA